MSSVTPGPSAPAASSEDLGRDELLSELARLRARVRELETERDHLRARSDARLRATEERYRLLFDSIDEGFCIIRVLFDEEDRAVDYRFVEVNAAFGAQTGLEDAVGRRMRSLRPDHERHWFEIYGDVARTRRPVRFDNPAAALDRWYDVYAFPVGEPEEHLVGVLFNDITVRKEVERERRERARALEEEAARKDWFLAMLGHELRNPLAPIRNAVELLRRDGLSADRRERYGEAPSWATMPSSSIASTCRNSAAPFSSMWSW